MIQVEPGILVPGARYPGELYGVPYRCFISLNTAGKAYFCDFDGDLEQFEPIYSSSSDTFHQQLKFRVNPKNKKALCEKPCGKNLEIEK